MKLLFHPILNLQIRNATEMVCIACYENEFFFEGSGSNKHVHVTNFLAFTLQLPSYLAILAKGINVILLEKIHYLHNIIEMFFSSRLLCAKIQFSKSNVRNFAFVDSYLSDMLNYTWLFFNQCDTYACVEQIFSMCQWSHTYQTSTSLTISTPCRNSFAISIGLLSPPQSLWKRARAASSLASDSSFQDGAVSLNTCQDLFASASSRATCADICSTSQRRSWRLKLLSMVSVASIGIVPTIVFITSSFFLVAKIR